MIAAIRNYAGIVAPGWLDLLALPERKEDEPDHKQAECDSEPLVQRHHVSFVGRIRASVQVSNDHLSRLQVARATGLPWQNSHILLDTAGSKETPMLARDEDILKAAEDWRRAGRGVALATVVETWGSAPRPVGSNLVIDTDGNFLGSVSGGCVEGAVVAEALDVIDSGKPKMLEFGVADETAWKVGLSCGGTIRVYVEKVE
jgi:hypothetical protein